MIKRESRYIIRRIIIGVGISLVLMLIKSLPVNAASCDSETITKAYYYNSTWTSFTNNPMTLSPSVDKIRIQFTNTNIQNKAIIKQTHSNVSVFGNHIENPTIIVLLKDNSSELNITNNCTNNINHSCRTYNDSLCVETTYDITTNCVFTSTNSSANKIEIQYSSNQGITRFYNDNNCLQINPTDTQQIIESQNQNGQNIVDSINDNGEYIESELNDIENAIEDLFPNFGSCRKMAHVILTPNKALNSSGQEVDNSNYGISGMIRVYSTDTLDRMKPSNDNVYACFYGNMNQLIECQTERQVINYQIPSDAYYVRFTWSQIDDSPETYHCSKDDQMVQNAIDDAAKEINDFRESYEKSQQVCNVIDKNNIVIREKYLGYNGSYINNSQWGITDYFNIYQSSVIIKQVNSRNGYTCFYAKDKTLINCVSQQNYVANTQLSIPNNTYYMRNSMILADGIPNYEICKNGNQGLYMYLSDSYNGTGNSYFDNFTPGNMHGLQNIITLPLDFVSSLNNSCQAIQLPSIDMYSYHFQLTIPCLSSYVYDSLPSALIDILKLLINGFIVYRILKWLFDFIIELRDPDYDELEVMDL